MTDVLVYQLTKTPKKKAMPKLLETIISKGNKVFIYCDNLAKQSELDEMLWTYEQLSFLPHATTNDPHPQKHPILIGTKLQPANILFLENFTANDNYQAYEKICVMIGLEDNANKINELVTSFKLPTTHFMQNEEGGWSKVAN